MAGLSEAAISGTRFATHPAMSPGGHLVTTAGVCAAAAMLTGSAALTAGIALGGFFIDVDHAVDYVLFERQADLRPGTFLRYYLEGRVQRLVLALHSYELFAALGVLAWWLQTPWLAGYLVGGLMHLALDIAFNGQLTPRSIWAFYSFAYRARHRFAGPALLGQTARQPASSRFWLDFFRGSRLERAGDYEARSPSAASAPARSLASSRVTASAATRDACASPSGPASTSSRQRRDSVRAT
jgi:hypothetical protein